MKIPILSGIYAKSSPSELGIAYPVNMVPVVLPSGINDGYLAPADGIVSQTSFNIFVSSSSDRGGINWNGVLYRVLGTKLCSIASDGTATVLGDVGPGGMCSFDYGYTTLVGKNYVAYLAILSGGRLYYYSPTASPNFDQVDDPNLGSPIDLVWSNGYFVLTDGTYVFNMELADPFTVAPGEYGTTDNDPDPIIALQKFQNEIYVLNRYTIQVLVNTGQPVVGDFTWSTVDGGQITKGCIGTHACCVFENNIAYLGSGRNEAPGIYVGANASATKISTVEIDRLLTSYTEAQLSTVVLEARNDNAHKHLYVHLPDRTLLFDAEASRAFGQPVWSVLSSGSSETPERYLARSFVWCYDRWNIAHPDFTFPFQVRVGYLSKTTTFHWGAQVYWSFSTPITYNEGSGALFHELELVALTGSLPSTTVSISTSYSTDGINWSDDKTSSIGAFGNTGKRIVWLKQGRMENRRIQRFTGFSQSQVPVIRLEARLEPLAY